MAQETMTIVINADDNASGVIGNIGKSLGSLGGAATATVAGLTTATAAAVGGLAAAIGVGVSKAADLEQGVADIAAVMGLAADEVSPLKDLIQDLGMDPALKVNATEASDAIMQLAQSGISMTDILDGAARNVVLLSNATGGDMALSAAIASDAMTLFNISAADMEQAVNQITGVTVASKFGIVDYQYALANVGGVASTLGVSFEDLNTTIAAISPSFASGMEAGTALKTLFSRMVPASDDAADAMRDIGLFSGMTADEMKKAESQAAKLREKIAQLDPTTSDFAQRSAELNQQLMVVTDSMQQGQNAFFNADGSMKSMAEIAGILQNAISGLSAEQKASTLNTIFGSDAIRAATAIADTGAEGFLNLAQNIAKVDADQSAATRMNTFSGAMEVLQGVLDGLMIGIGDAFLPILRILVETITDLSSTHGPAIINMFQSLAQTISTLTTSFLGAVNSGNLLSNLLTLMPGPIQGITLAIISFVAAIQNLLIEQGYWKDALIALGIVIAATVIPMLVSLVTTMAPIIAAVAALIAVIHVLRMAFESNFGGIRDFVTSALSIVIDTFTQVQNGTITLQEGIGRVFNGIVNLVREYLPQWQAILATWATAIWQWIVNATPVVIAQLTQWGTQLFNWLSQNLPGWVSRLSAWGTAIWQWIVNATPVVIAQLTQWGTQLFNWLSQNLPGWVSRLSAWGTAIWQWIVNATPVVIAQLTQWGTQLFNWLSQNLPGWVSRLSAWGTAIWQWIVNATPVVIAQLTRWGTQLLTWLNQNLPGWIARLSTWATAIWQWIVDATPVVVAKLVEWGTQLLNWLSQNLPGWVARLSTWATAIWQWIVNATPVVVAKLAEWGTQLFNWVIQNLPTWISRLSGWATAIWKWIVDATPVVVAKLTEWGAALLKWLTDNLPGWIAKLGGWATAIWKWIVDATPVVVAKLTEWGAALLKWLTDNLPGWIAKLGGWATAIWKWIVDATPVVVAKLTEWGAALLKWLTDNLPGWIAKLGGWATAIWKWIVDATPVVVAKLTEWGAALLKWLTDNLPGWIAKLGGWATAIWKWIVDATPVVVAKLTEWGAALLKWLTDNLPGWIAKLGGWATAIWQWISNALPTAIVEMGKWGAALFKWLTDNLPAWLRQVGTWVDGLTSSFATGIQAGLPNIQTQIGNIWTALDNQFALADKLASAKNWGTVLFNNLRDGIAASDGTVLGAATAIWNVLRDMFGIDSKLLNVKTWGTNLITNLAAGILAVQHIVIHNASQIWTSIKTEIEKLNLHDVGQNIIQGLANGIVGKLNELMAVGGSIQVIFSNLLAFIRGFFQEASPSKVMMRLGKNVMLGMELGMAENIPDMSKNPKLQKLASDMTGTVSSGISGGLGDVDKAARQVIETFKSKLSASDFLEIGANLINAVIAGFTRGIGSAGNSAQQLVDSFKNKLSVNEFINIGGSLIDGLNRGIQSKMNWLTSNVINGLNWIIEQIRRIFRISSPSKVMENLGRDLMLGMEQGMLKNIPAVLNAAQSMASGVMHATDNLALSPQLSLPSIGTLSNQDMMRPNVTTNNMTYNLSYETMRSAESIQQDIELLNLLYGGGRSA